MTLGFIQTSDCKILESVGWYGCYLINLCSRDSKQYAGIINCQSTDFKKLTFHFNESLMVVNLAKTTYFIEM